jgi:hypothetical protein
MRSEATLFSWRWRGQASRPLPPPFYPAALRAGWNALDCHGPAALAMTRWGGFRDGGFFRWILPSPAGGGGWPKAGRGLPTIRREAPLIKKGVGGRERLSIPHRKEISVAALRMEENPLPPLTGHPPPQAGEGTASGFRNGEFLRWTLPSPACGGGWPKAGRGLPTIRREAPLISLRREVDEHFNFISRPPFQSAARRVIER